MKLFQIRTQSNVCALNFMIVCHTENDKKSNNFTMFNELNDSKKEKCKKEVEYNRNWFNVISNMHW